MSGSAPHVVGGVVIEHKKGEVNELKISLRNPALDRDPEKKREVIKRVIAYMTLGIDVSKLFSEMIMVGGNTSHNLNVNCYARKGQMCLCRKLPVLALLT